MLPSLLSQNKIIGDLGEKFTVKLLKHTGYQIVEKNYRSKYGEVDIIATKNNELIFFEVKCRRSFRFGTPEEAINYHKKIKLKKLAEYYSLIHPRLPKKLRIQLVALVLKNYKIAHSKILDVY